MSTRAIYIFKDNVDMHVVYKHHDGYPKDAVKTLTVAQHLSWQGGRFESDEAAASFVAAAKLTSELRLKGGKLVFTPSIYPTAGSTRLMHKGTKKNIFASAPGDIAFAYLIEAHPGAGWYVTVYETSFWNGASSDAAKKIWEGPLNEMAAWTES